MIRPVTHLETRPLRRKVLRPHQQEHELFFPGDDAPDTVHFGAFSGGGGLVGVASVYRKPAEPSRAEVAPHLVGPNAWQLRGMATDPSVRGAGFGGQLLEACLHHARDRGGLAFWCNARTTVLAFYERYGLTVVGEPYDLPGIGPHVWMWRSLAVAT